MKFESIQVCRAIAANAVVFSHLLGIEDKYGKGYALLPHWLGPFGHAGVHLFFVISGFVMIFAANGQTWQNFLTARITRIYPIYWFYTSIVVFLILAVPASVSFSLPPYSSIVTSYLLWPDGAAPLLTVGWSLVFEMHFYLVLTLIIAFGIPIGWALLGWSIVTIVLMMTIESPIPLISTASSPLILEFIAGGIVGLIVKSGRTQGGYLTLVVGIVALMLGLLHYGPNLIAGDRSFPHACAMGISFSLIVYGVTAIEQTGRWPRLTLFTLLGNASYSTYLSHIIVLSALGRVYFAAPLSGWVAEIGFVVFCIAVTNLVGVASYYWLEKPSMRGTRFLFGSATKPAL